MMYTMNYICPAYFTNFTCHFQRKGRRRCEVNKIKKNTNGSLRFMIQMWKQKNYVVTINRQLNGDSFCLNL